MTQGKKGSGQLQATPSMSISVAKVLDPRTVKARRAKRQTRPRPPFDRAKLDKELEAHGLTVSLQGSPHARPEPRGWKGTKRVVNAPKKVRKYIEALERQIRTAVQNAGGDEVVHATFGQRPLLVRIVWSFKTPQEDRWGEPHLFRPDVDNLEKLVLDCLKRAGALGGDDCQVARVEKSKEWDMEGWVWCLVKPIIPLDKLSHHGTKHEAGNLYESVHLAPRWLRG